MLNGGDNVRITGGEGIVLFRDEGTWDRINSATSMPAVKVSFPAAEEGFAIGLSFFISHYVDD